MKRIAFYFGIATALMASCSTQEKDFQTPQQEEVIYYASFEQPAEEGTRVYANEDLQLRWTADDRVSIFSKNTYNQQYQFLGETGDNSGEFSKVDGAEYVTGNPISHTVSVYPYQASTKITEEEVITLTLPAGQHYAKNTFGLGANTMVSVSEDNFLQYKNVGGYLMIKLYGEGVSVLSLTLRGNNGEKLAGKASVTMPIDGEPSVEMASEATTEITLTYDTPIQLGATAEDATPFWFVVPPVSFDKGFQITVSGESGVFEKSTEKMVTIGRNNLSKMSPIEVEFLQPNNVIYYTSVSGEVVTPYTTDVFGATLLSNEYSKGIGVMTFDGDITEIGTNAFYAREDLASISIPGGVKSIGDYAFFDCLGLTSFVVPEGVNTIGKKAFFSSKNITSILLPNTLTDIGLLAFYDCNSLSSIVIPESVSTIGEYAFRDCLSLSDVSVESGNPIYDSRNNCNAIIETRSNTLILGCDNTIIPEDIECIGEEAFTSRIISTSTITIPEGVTSIESRAFSKCSGLASIELPRSLTSIGSSAFESCTSLLSISIPEGVTDLKSSTFRGCINCVSVYLPSSLTSIGSTAFQGCSSLISITIPKGVESIGSQAFRQCSGLSSIAVEQGNTVYDSRDNSNAIIETASNTLLWGCKNSKIPDGIQRIGDFAFQECDLTQIEIPHSVTTIGWCSFYQCTELRSVALPNSLTSIGQAAFSRCGSLTSITIPKKVESIGETAFRNCSGLERITVLPEIPPLGGRQMIDNTNDCPIFVPAVSLEAYSSAEFWSDYAGRIQALVPLPESVDLGLPSGLKWASFNLGASAPEQLGDYFAWGEIEPYYSSQDPLTWKEGKESGYSWTSYKWCMGTPKTLTKYCTNSPDDTYGYNGFTDDKTVLDIEDDVAGLNLGGKWRMPTETEWAELIENCTWTWTTQNEVNGMLVTASNGNSLFFPCAGFRYSAVIAGVGSYGRYWSSSLYTVLPNNAWSVYFSSSKLRSEFNSRHDGFSIRPVLESSN